MNPKALQIIGLSLIVISLAGGIYSIVSGKSLPVFFFALVPIGVALNVLASRKAPPAV
jgi:hypothetical protein